MKNSDQFQIIVIGEDTLDKDILLEPNGIRNDIKIVTCQSGRDCIDLLKESPALIALPFDGNLPAGKELVFKIKKESPGTEVLVITNPENLVSAYELLKPGALEILQRSEFLGPIIRRLLAALMDCHKLKMKLKNLEENSFFNEGYSLKNYTFRIINHYLKNNDNDVSAVARLLEVGKSTIYRIIQTEGYKAFSLEK